MQQHHPRPTVGVLLKLLGFLGIAVMLIAVTKFLNARAHATRPYVPTPYVSLADPDRDVTTIPKLCQAIGELTYKVALGRNVGITREETTLRMLKDVPIALTKRLYDVILDRVYTLQRWDSPKAVAGTMETQCYILASPIW